jgi:hypothetical protein
MLDRFARNHQPEGARLSKLDRNDLIGRAQVLWISAALAFFPDAAP